ncbi:ATP-dependent exoDNAse (exonuclease V) beta subunit (contains helicase and exonuclease domains) [Brevibacterium sandarakinum]|uniref:DNA 3'-5' helicase n=1 Tax=Brevibacterium sandarakinum TaxID=629680 RepID=A0A1H1WPK2_BRESA|nr:UvrD-helicase domain-containing protein [Brevibacterium sandarakinum]SDS99063.1 ATP-dependent exoDNAse (exonuclease V) beta subunit (contains helicase and exonuclease domains) [Brevibacterium sandarakinum]
MSVHVITASAGSGKTYRLTEVLSRRLTDTPADGTRPLKASEVIATTFTVRAAADLVEKTQKRLLDDGNTVAAEEIGTALIGTINSVSGRLVTDYAIDAGYSPELRVLDESEQAMVFTAAVDDVIADAEAAHRDLLLRTGHNGNPEDTNPFGHGPVVWSGLVKSVAEAARANHLGEVKLRESADASVELFLSSMPERRPDRREAWRGRLASDIDQLRAALRHFNGDELDTTAAPPITIDKRSAGNVEGSIITLDHFLRDLDARGDLDARAEEDDPNAGIAWSTWAKVAEMKYPQAPGGKTLGKVPKQVLETSSASLVAGELLANDAFHDDVEALIRLIIDTAIASLDAYEEHKNRLGVMDFVDQEVRALDLLRTNDRVRRSVASKFRLLAVDEFQDSSPIQLAIFVELAELVDEVVWVGDRKQAIYGFRGADPELMNDVFSALIDGQTELGTATTENLGASWRSTDPPLDLSNAIFSSVFADQPEDEVVLSIPPARQAQRAAGGRELWVPNTDKGGTRSSDSRMVRTIAEGVVDFLSRSPQLSDRDAGVGDIAVLVRTNTQVAKTVAELHERGIPSIGSTTDLLATREGQIVAAGLAAVVDPKDTVALAELVTLLSDHEHHESWFDDAVRIADEDERRKRPSTWWSDPALAALSKLTTQGSQHVAVELLLAVIDALDLPQRIKTWSAPETRLSTLDAFCQIAAEYEDASHQTRMPVTPAGLLNHLTEAAGAFEQTTAHDAVLVTTMHQSKGLQWPVVIVGVSAHKDYGHREVTVEKAPVFDARHPLANRSLRLLPKVLKDFGPVKERLGQTDSVRRSTESERNEAARLLYVALTRAECHSVMAFGDPTGTNNVLNAAVDEELLTWDLPEISDDSVPSADETGELRIANRRALGNENVSMQFDLPIRICAYSLSSEPSQDVQAPQLSFFAHTDIAMRRPFKGAAGIPSRFTASSVESEGIDADVSVFARLGEPLVGKGGKDWDRIGDAVHAYLGLPLSSLTEETAKDAAERILHRWNAGTVLSAKSLVEIGRRWTEWIDTTFPGAEVLTEQPIVWRNEAGQVMEGWIDTLLNLPNGDCVLVDHKTYPGTNPIGHIRENYLGQLATYVQALEGTTGRCRSQVLIHLPLLGEIVEVGNRAETI